MACFVALPLALQEHAGLPREQHWWVYLAGLLLSFIGMVPLIIYAERRRRMKRVVLGAILLLALTQLLMWLSMNSLAALVVARSEEHTSELQSRPHLVCRLLLEKK